MLEKVISKANLALRFYTSNGWTRKDVAELLENPRIELVFPRYFDYEKDEEVMKLKDGFLMSSDANLHDYSDCDYFSVYNATARFSQEKLEQFKFSNNVPMS